MEWQSPGYERLLQALKDIIASQPDIEGALAVTTDGFHIVSILPWDIQEAQLALIAASLSALASSAATITYATGRGKIDGLAEVIIKAELGYVLVLHVKDDLWFIALCRPQAQLGLLLSSFSPLGGLDLPRRPLSPTPDPVFPGRPPGSLSVHAEPEYDDEE